MNNVFFQYYSVFILAVCAETLLLVRYAGPPPASERVAGLTVDTLTAEQRRQSRLSWNRWDVICSFIVIAAIAAAYVYFRG